MEHAGGAAGVSTVFSTECVTACLLEKPSRTVCEIAKNKGFSWRYPKVTTARICPHALDRSRTAQEPYGQHEQRTEQTENPVDGDPNDAKRKRQ